MIERLELAHTPRHGRWLNAAECEFRALKRPCLDRRIATVEESRQEIAAWQRPSNARQKGGDWHFTTADARVKLKRLYSSFVS